jgi:methyl-accepting chemotaxis protein
MTVRSRFTLLTCGVLLAVVVMGGLAFWGAREIMVEELVRSGDEAAHFSQLSIENWLKSRKQLVFNTAGNVAYLWEDYGATEVILMGYMEELTRKNAEEGYLDIYVGFPNGRFADGAGWIPPSDFDPTTRPWYQQALEKNDVIFTSPFVDANSGQLIVSVACPAYDSEGDLVGVVGADLDLGVIRDQVLGQRIRGNGQGFLADVSGLCMVHPDPEKVMKMNLREGEGEEGILSLGGSIFASPEGGYASFSEKGETHLAFFRPLFTGWRLVLTVSESLLLKPLRVMAFKLFLVGLALLIGLFIFVFFMNRGVLRPLEALRGVALRAEKGDLTVRAETPKKDEIAQVSNAIDSMLVSLRTFFLQLCSYSSKLHEGSSALGDTARKDKEIAEVLRNRAAGLAEESRFSAEAIQNANAGMEEISAGIQENARASQEASGSAEDLRKEALAAGEAITSAAQRIGEMSSSFDDVSLSVANLHETAGKIGDIVKTITGIADQTNLLALNAAIEAARAGDAGRGFAVVAEEVRKLAEESNSAAGEIGTLASEIIANTQKAVSVAEEGKTFASRGSEESEKMQKNIASVLGAVENIASQVQSIASTAEEQSAGAQEMASSIDRITSGVGKTRSEAEAIEEDIRVLGEGVKKLGELVKMLEDLSQAMQQQLGKYRLEEHCAALAEGS